MIKPPPAPTALTTPERQGKEGKEGKQGMVPLPWTTRANVLTAVCVFLLSVVNADAKEDTMFDAGFTSVGTAESTEAGHTTEMTRTLTWVSARLGTKLSDNTYFMYGAEYTAQFIDYNAFVPVVVRGNVVREADLPDTLHAVEVIGGLYWILSDGWSATMELRPGLYSDLKDVDRHDVIMIATGLAERRFGTNSRWGIGIAYADFPGRRLPVPILRLFWRPTTRWFVETTLPRDLDVGFRLSEEFSIGIGGRLRGYRYRLEEGEPFQEGVLKLFHVQVGPFLNYELWRGEDDRFKANFRVSGGLVTAQRFKIMDRAGDQTLIKEDMKDAGYVTANFYIAF